MSELTHPHIIQVFDYGLDAAGPFYTMEVLEHGDRRFSREDYATLAADAAPQQLDESIMELLAQGLIAAVGTRYELLHRNWVHFLTAHLTTQENPFGLRSSAS